MSESSPRSGSCTGSLDTIRDDLERIHDLLSPCEIIITDIEANCPDKRVADFYSLCGEIWRMEPRELVPKTMSI